MRRTAKNNKNAPLVPKAAAARRGLDKRYIAYVRDKVNQLLQVMGTSALRPEELDDGALLELDPIGIIAGSFEQILEHLRETNRSLSIARDELQAIFDATGVGISIIDEDFRILKSNEKLRRLLAADGAGDITGRFCYEVYCGKEGPGLDCPAVDTLATGRSVIVREVSKKGKHFQIATTPFKDGEGNIIGVIEVLMDISDLKTAKDAEREQRGFYLAEKSKLAAVIESLSEGLFVTDASDRIVSFNRAARKMTGYSESEVQGLRFQEFIAGLGGPSCAVIEERDFKSGELSITSKDGRHRIISVSSVLLRDGDARHGEKVFTFRDITEEKHLQESYCRTEKLAALGQLSAGVAHELNTPLGSILGYARLLTKGKNLSPDQRERLDIIAEQAKRGSAIITGLLNFARRSDPALREMALIDINDVIGGVVRMLTTEAEKRNITVLMEFGGIPPLMADRRQMEQVIINMLLNAIQSVRKNGQVSVRTSSAGDSVKIMIADNGPGIPPDIRPRIFDPFFTTKPVGEGTGLGLSICAGIVSEHNGSIDVDGESGKGAVFTVTLPVNHS